MPAIREARKYVDEFGAAFLFAGLARRSRQHIRHLRGRIGRTRPSFSYAGREFEQFWHPYNRTWLSERALEVPVASAFVARFGEKSAGLEIGNVLSHYGIAGHRVIDKYEVGQGVENVDVIDVTSDGPIDWIVAISTLEHVGWDEPNHDVDKAVKALLHLRRLLRPGTGRLLLTAPLGHNPGLDRFLLSEDADAIERAMYTRDARDRWSSVDQPAPSQQRYMYELRSAATVWIGEFGAISPSDGPRADLSPAPLSTSQFRRRFVAGELSLARWTECSISPSEVHGLDGDPRAQTYADAVFATWAAITARDRYDPAVDETFTLDDADYLARPYPYSSSNPVEVGNYFGAVAAAVARTGGPPPRRVVEYGSGWGHLALALAQTGYEVTAVDLNPASVELLRLRAKVLGVPLDVAQCGFLEYEPDQPVDVIIFFESFHHCERPFELLDRCTASLAPGGRLVFIADAIYDDFYAPWGVRLDGSATFMAAQQGWLELGFRRDFFEAELVSRGFDVAWEVLPWLGAYGTVMTADRRETGERP